MRRLKLFIQCVICAYQAFKVYETIPDTVELSSNAKQLLENPVLVHIMNTLKKQTIEHIERCDYRDKDGIEALVHRLKSIDWLNLKLHGLINAARFEQKTKGDN